MAKSTSTVQLAWGFALLLAGVLTCLRVPDKVPEIASTLHINPGVYLYICFYLIGVLLAISGIAKIVYHYRSAGNGHSNTPNGS